MNDRKHQALRDFQTLFAAAGLAKLSRDEHAAIQKAGQGLGRVLDECLPDDKPEEPPKEPQQPEG